MKEVRKIGIVGILMIVLVITLIVMVAVLSNAMNRIESLEKSTNATDVDISELTVSTEATPVDKKDTKDTADKLLEQLEYVRTTNIKFLGYEGEDQYGLYVTNNSGESTWLRSDGGAIVFDKNNKVVSFTDANIGYGDDASPVNTAILACKALKDGYASCSTTELTQDSATATEYLIDVEGYENIQKMYTFINDEFAISKIEQLKIGVQDSTSELTDLKGDKSVLNFRIAIVVSEGKVVSMGEYFYFGENASGYWDNCVPEWSFDSGTEVDSWKMADTWYSYDYNNMKNEDLTLMRSELEKTIYTALGIDESDLQETESNTTSSEETN